VVDSASMRRTLASTGTGSSFWSPSRGPTSRTSTCSGQPYMPDTLRGADGGPSRSPLRTPVRSAVARAAAELDRRRPEIERLSQLPLEIAEVLVRERTGREQRERGRVGGALCGVEDAGPVLLHDRRRVCVLRVAQHTVERRGRDPLVVRLLGLTQ